MFMISAVAWRDSVVGPKAASEFVFLAADSTSSWDLFDDF